MVLAYVLASLAWAVISVIVFLGGLFVSQKLFAKLLSSWMSDLSVAAVAGAAQFVGLMAVCFIIGYFDVPLIFYFKGNYIKCSAADSDDG